MLNLGEKIKKLREDAKLTQEELANMLYVSNKTISSWEVNRTMPDINMLFKISNIFNCNLYSLVNENYYNNVPLEIEVKLKLEQNEFTRLKKLLENKSKEIKTVNQTDIYFEIPRKSKIKECLRIRNENNRYILCYKNDNTKCIRNEYETLVDNYENLEQILYHLGIKKKGIIQKERIKIMYQNKYEFSFDKVKDIGLFLEIEVKKIENDNLVELDKLFNLLKELKIDLNLITNKKYNEYLGGSYE